MLWVFSLVYSFARYEKTHLVSVTFKLSYKKIMTDSLNNSEYTCTFVWECGFLLLVLDVGQLKNSILQENCEVDLYRQ